MIQARPQVRTGIVSREFLLLFGAIALVASAVLGAYHYLTSSMAVDAVTQREASRIELAGSAAERTLELITTDLLVLAKNNTLQQLLLRSKNQMPLWAQVAQELVLVSRQKGIYDQIRFLDTGGMEVVRVNYDGGTPSIVAPHLLQNKAGRYYFKDSIVLSKEEVFVSPLDLNVEHGRVERPFKPMIRLATPVFDGRGRKRGVLIVNYSAAHLLDLFQEILGRGKGHGMVLNGDGYWLLGPDDDKAWGFMFENGPSFASTYPEAWPQIRDQETGRIRSGNGEIVFATVRPLRGAVTSVERSRPEPLSAQEKSAARTYAWKIVSHLDRDLLADHYTSSLPLLLVLLAALLTLGGVASWAIAVGRDQKRRHEAEILSQRDWLNTLINAMPDIVCLKDGEGRWMVANDFARKLLWLPDLDYRGLTDEELATKGGLHEATFLSSMATDEKAWRSGMTFRYEEKIAQPDGPSRIFEMIKVPLLEADGETRRGMVVIGRDITRRKEAETEVATALEEAERSNTELEQFAYAASHDLREPLRMINSYLKLLTRRLGNELDTDANEYIDFAVDGAQRMDAMINDLLAYSRIGRRDAGMEPLFARESLEEALTNLAVAIDESGAKITVEGEDPVVEANPNELTRLFQNLIGNAIKYQAPGRPPEVTIDISRREEEWLFAIKDNGIGIEEKDFDRVFMIFQRLHGRSEYEGTGIGLAACKKIVERHQGRIWVDSRPGEGSTFTFSLPAQ